MPVKDRKAWYAANREREAKRSRDYYHANIEAERARQRGKKRSRCAATPEEYDRMVQAQSGLCAICQQDGGGPLKADHDHETVRLRGLLCLLCNVGLGCFKDDPERLVVAASYVQV